MGVYAITGGSSGIGAKTREILIGEGHEVINIDLAGGEIDANLAKPDGRQHSIDELCRMCPAKYGHDALMDPEEIAEVMVFLSSHKARGINGNISDSEAAFISNLGGYYI